jgi:hypothetical protein
MFTMRRLEDFVPADHPLRPIRAMVNEALRKMDGLFAGMYEDDIEGGRSFIAPEKLLRDAAVDLLQRALGAAIHGVDPIQPLVRSCKRDPGGRNGPKAAASPLHRLLRVCRAARGLLQSVIR